MERRQCLALVLSTFACAWTTFGANPLSAEFEPDFTASPNSNNPDSNHLRELSVYMYSLELESVVFVDRNFSSRTLLILSCLGSFF